MNITKNISILIVEDEMAIREMLRFGLAPTNFNIIEAENVRAARQKIAAHTPDLILLDWMLPDISGIDFIKQLKQTMPDIPIILLTARADENSKIKGLESGADDYITKPFSIRELTARINTILRRSNVTLSNVVINIKNLAINTNSHQASINNQLLTLTPLEYKLLLFLMQHPNKVHSRERITARVWGSCSDINDRTIDVQIRRLRARLKPFGYDNLLQAVRGIGYQLLTSAI